MYKIKLIRKIPMKIRVLLIAMALEENFDEFFKVTYNDNTLIVRYVNPDLENTNRFLTKVFVICNQFFDYQNNWNLDLNRL